MKNNLKTSKQINNRTKKTKRNNMTTKHDTNMYDIQLSLQKIDLSVCISEQKKIIIKPNQT